MADLTDYTGLITSEHNQKPKFMATVAALAGSYADLINVLQSMPTAFDLDAAIGVQLDAVGLWVGVTRNVDVPLTGVYFSLDTAGVGLDQGVWMGPFDPSTGVTRLDDDTYRLLIRARIAANHWDGTPVVVQDTVPGQFIPLVGYSDQSTYVFIQDNGDMTITIGISGVLPSALFLALLSGGYLPVKPSGVHADYVATSNSGTPVFGFDVNNQYIGGLDTGAWGTTL